MLTSYELSILFALAKDYWTGAGEIVDLGCLYGLTTRCFAEGLSLNTIADDSAKAKRIYAFDLFLAENYEWWTQASRTVHAGSWFSEFIDLNLDHMPFIAPCPGDLLKMSWGDKPIEILMIDAAKSWELNHWVVSRMFPHLIPGQSIVVQQDYVHLAEYWCAITMEYYHDRFETLDFVYGASGVFRSIEPISAAEAAFDLGSLEDSEKKALMDRAIAKAPPSVAEVLKVAKAKMLIDMGELAEAKRLLASVSTKVLNENSPGDFSGIAAGCLVKIAVDVARAEQAEAAGRH